MSNIKLVHTNADGLAVMHEDPTSSKLLYCTLAGDLNGLGVANCSECKNKDSIDCDVDLDRILVDLQFLERFESNALMVHLSHLPRLSEVPLEEAVVCILEALGKFGEVESVG